MLLLSGSWPEPLPGGRSWVLSRTISPPLPASRVAVLRVAPGGQELPAEPCLAGSGIGVADHVSEFVNNAYPFWLLG